MSEETTQQTVVDDTEGQAKPGAEAGDARKEDDDLQALLDEYNQDEEQAKAEPVKATAQKPSKPEPEPKGTDPDLQALAARVEAWERQQAEQSFRADMNKVIKEVRGDLDPALFDDAFMDAWVESQARADERLQRAWRTRNEKPKEFSRVVDGLSRAFQSRFSKLPDKQATEDREAVAAAVRGASTKAPEPKAQDYTALSNNEFREKVEKEYGFSPLI